ncbi:MAG: methyltransferase domain-containing protein [Bacteroides sp.]|nr:methyltransferase domain-containing protein [Bacteroides sp.]
MYTSGQQTVKDINVWNQMGDNFWLSRTPRQRWANDHILYPELFKMLDNGPYNSILDYGCGDGSLCKYLLEKNVDCQIHAYDPSSSMAMLAARNLGEEYVPETLNEGMYDVIFLNLVLQDVDDPSVTLETLHKILSPKGSVMITIPHPIFTLIESRHVTTTRESKQSNKKGIYKYLDEVVESVYWDSMRQNQSVAYNRMISTYIHYFNNSGFTVTGLSEPLPLDSGKVEADLYAINSELPAFMIFKLQKS